ncbi:hypothetical protein LTR66_007832 [Elasticomyces elasticus]|nr:hypothetical protein LTR66_007832 [Elasticomyces elasticus]
MAGPFFRSVVVPLNAEIYHKIDGPGHLQWRHAKDDPTGKVYEEHGLRVFEGFGHHILKFGMSFEVDEATLRKGLPKHPLKRVMAFYGEYDWLDPQYCRSADRDGLECTAYEISTMKLAFSHLHRVQELALSLDSGLGWLSGPDNSLRARVLHRSPAIFGSARNGPDRKTQAQIELWVLSKRRLAGTWCSKTQDWTRSDARVFFDAVGLDLTDSRALSGVLVACPHTYNLDPRQRSFIPDKLSDEQKEWLLETERAQRAFLLSYMLAIVHNEPVGKHVTTLNLAQLSSRYVQSLCRDDFWHALPNLEAVILRVKPDWRTVLRNDEGVADTQPLQPSAVHDAVVGLVGGYIAPKRTVKKLTLGWAAGGEHAEGIYARNSQILPAPINLLVSTLLADGAHEGDLELPHVEHLTLVNCWITPTKAVQLIRGQHRLEKVTLDSVSLTAHTRLIYANGTLHTQTAAQTVDTNLQPNNTVLWQAAMDLTPRQFYSRFHLRSVADPTIINPHWTEGHREGSWPELIDTLSPGITFEHCRMYERGEPEPQRPYTSLTELEFISCGYAFIKPLHFAQYVLEPIRRSVYSAYFTMRFEMLLPSMMITDDPYLGIIVQYMSERELEALQRAWGMRSGWSDIKKAEEATFDGMLPGGTGRFSGRIERSGLSDWFA